MNRMMAAVILMVLLTLFMLAAAFPVAGSSLAMIFKTPVFIGLGGLLAGLLVYCSWTSAGGFRRIGFLLTHLGVVVIMAGALVGLGSGESHDLVLPIGGAGFVREIQKQDGSTVPLPFGIRCQRFGVDYYDPSYDLYEPVSKGGNPDYRKVATHTMSLSGELNLGRFGRMGREALFNPETAAWRSQVVLTNGWILQQNSPSVRLFSAEIAIRAEGQPEDVRHLAVNKPIGIQGWRFYLMSYDTQNNSYVVLMARRDPGRLAVVAGIWMTIVGTILLGIAGVVGKRGAP